MWDQMFRRSLCMMQDMCACGPGSATQLFPSLSFSQSPLFVCARAVYVCGRFFLMTNHFLLYIRSHVYSSYSVPTTQVRSLRDLCDHLVTQSPCTGRARRGINKPLVYSRSGCIRVYRLRTGIAHPKLQQRADCLVASALRRCWPWQWRLSSPLWSWSWQLEEGLRGDTFH